MFDTTRRGFLAGVLSLAATPVIAQQSLPTIYGDGIHDDADGLQAMFDGRPFAIEGEGFTASSGRLAGGRFLVSRPVVLPWDDGWSITDCIFWADDGVMSPLVWPVVGCGMVPA